MKREDYVIIWLTLQLTITSVLYCEALAKASYLQGQLDMQQSYIQNDDLDGKGNK
jgi:hypothetical protein